MNSMVVQFEPCPSCPKQLELWGTHLLAEQGLPGTCALAWQDPRCVYGNESINHNWVSGVSIGMTVWPHFQFVGTYLPTFQISFRSLIPQEQDQGDIQQKISATFPSNSIALSTSFNIILIILEISWTCHHWESAELLISLTKAPQRHA